MLCYVAFLIVFLAHFDQRLPFFLHASVDTVFGLLIIKYYAHYTDKMVGCFRYFRSTGICMVI